jgi:hypothetical protein
MAKVKNLGDLIKSKGLLMYHVREKLNEAGVNCNSSTFSRWCKGRRKPQNPYAITILSKVLGEEVETIKNLLKQ